MSLNVLVVHVYMGYLHVALSRSSSWEAYLFRAMWMFVAVSGASNAVNISAN